MPATLKILVVDDEEAMREVLRERLESWGFEVSTAADGAAPSAGSRPSIPTPCCPTWSCRTPRGSTS